MQRRCVRMGEEPLIEHLQRGGEGAAFPGILHPLGDARALVVQEPLGESVARDHDEGPRQGAHDSEAITKDGWRDIEKGHDEQWSDGRAER